MFIFQPVINISVTIGLIVFVTKHIGSHIFKYGQYFAFFIWIVFFLISFDKYHPYQLSIILNALKALQCFKPTLSSLLINNWNLSSDEFSTYNYFCQYQVGDLQD